jgi:uncharacterized protein with ParB-like and HNH nuclease domain
MAELIYNIRYIFSTDNSDCCLIEYDADKYHIAAYQRGYKWASDEYGAVTILLNDLWDAFEAFKNQERKEYYLQYITLKKNVDKRHLEVIDGQQRLTTLSILLSIFSLKLEIDNISKGKLEYAIRENFFDNHIYNSSNLKALLEKQWDDKEGLVFSASETINSQDVYYLFNAALKINKFLTDDDVLKQIKPFYEFVLNKVKIIVNAVDHISSEKVFSNLNSNKVPLTEAELIKGLLLTKYSRLHNQDEGKKHFREILEMRLLLGRQWDEMTRWSNQSEINSFFFDEEGMTSLLTLVAMQNGYKVENKANPNDYPLFNFFHKFGKTETIYKNLLSTYFVLNDWFNEDKIFNLLGYLFFAKGSGKVLKDYLPKIGFTKTKLLSDLIDEVKLLIPKNTDQLFYSNDQDNEIHRVLLALNVFSDGIDKRFNYHRFIEDKWTLEHIFPQTPEGKGQILKEKDKQIILEVLGDKATDEIKVILAKTERSTEEKEIYQTALKSIGSLNSIGNMCLLTDKDNSSNGCGFFDEKRTNILERIRKGSFVPKHTFDVFSKMVFDINPGDFERWTNDNILNHSLKIKTSINAIKLT